MTALSWVFAVSAATGVLAFLADRVLKPWKARRIAEADERRAVAQLMSEQMQAGIKVLIGDPGNPAQGIPATEGLGKRMTQVEAQLKTNGGNSARDVLDKIHEVAIENAEANARVERGQQEAAALAAAAEAKAAEAARFAGETGIVASRTEQRVAELAATTDVRHAENTARLDALESNGEDVRIQREFLLHLLRTKHGIDLIDDEDDDESGGT